MPRLMFRILVLSTIALSSCASTPKTQPLALPELSLTELTAVRASVGEWEASPLEAQEGSGTSAKVLAFVAAIRRDSTVGTRLEGTTPTAFLSPADTIRAFLEHLEARDDVVYLHKSANEVAVGEVLEPLMPATVPAVVGWDILQLESETGAAPRELQARAGNGLQIRALPGGGVEAQLELIASLPASRSQATPWPDAEPLPVGLPLAAAQLARCFTPRTDEALVLCGTYPQKPWPRVVAVVLRSGESSAGASEFGNRLEATP
ncbi:MAG: hypothetical protein AAF368_07510 [Planctomycetota bacterium]